VLVKVLYRLSMGLIGELQYEVKDANAIQRCTQKLTASGPGAWVFQRTLYPIDKGVFRLTKGRLTVPGFDGGTSGHPAHDNGCALRPRPRLLTAQRRSR
jgi:hypothetical protein